MEQTAVEFLVKEFSEILGQIKTETMQDLLLVDAINRAKEMEKEQRSQANNGNYCAVCGGTEFWYNEELDSSIVEDDDEEYDDDEED